MQLRPYLSKDILDFVYRIVFILVIWTPIIERLYVLNTA